MRVLFIHSDYLEYEVKERTKFAEDIPRNLRKGRMEDALVSFIAFEKEDENNVHGVAQAGAREIENVAGTLKAKRIVLYPYAHLSSSLARPNKAKQILAGMGKELRERGYEILAPPFGWYKAFKLACKGHPLSELSREIVVGEAAARAEPIHDFLILTQEGKEYKPEKYKGGSEAFQTMVKKEALKEEYPVSGEPGYMRLCRKFGFEWEDMSDVGHIRYEPKAALMFDLVADYASYVVGSLGLPVFTLKGTNMFNLDEPAVSEHAELYGDRLYTIETEKKSFVMRYAACHQQFSTLRNWMISYKQLPFGAFEVADSYRLEQSGELSLLFRDRRLNMPDLHILCKNKKEAKEWLLKIHKKIMEEGRKLNRDYEILVNLSSRKAYEDNRDLILKLLKEDGKEALLNFYPGGRNFYWTVNVEYLIEDDVRHAREIATVQIDVGNAKRFGIHYTDEKGRERYPIILHTAILGTVERYLFMVLDGAIQKERHGERGFLPFWLNPEQVRLLTVREDHINKAREIASFLERNQIRVGLDDRKETIPKKVREAKQDWIGYVIVIGDREMEEKTLKIYDRERNEDRKMELQPFIAEMREKSRGMPFKSMYFPMEMTKRPIP